MSSLITNATIQIRKDTAGNWTTNNPTPAQGEWCLETDTGAFKLGDGSTAWNDLEYRQQLPFTYDLTGSNITHTLPLITRFPQTESIYAINGGTYKLTLAVTDSEDVGGIAAATWEIEGEGKIIVESDGTNWQVKEYLDSWNDSTENYNKYSNGYITQELNITTEVDGATTWTYPVSMTSVLTSFVQSHAPADSNIFHTTSVTTSSLVINQRTGAGAATPVSVIVTGRWRA